MNLLISILLLTVLNIHDYNLDELKPLLGSSDIASHEFYQISDIKVSADYIYVADRHSKKVFRFSKTGELINKFGRSGRGPGEFSSGPDLIIVMKNELYIQDAMSSTIVVLSHDLEYIRNLPASPHYQSAYHIVKNTDENLLMAMTAIVEPGLGMYSKEGELLHGISLSENPDAGPIFKDRFYMSASNQNLFLVWRFINRIEIRTNDGQLIRSCRIENAPDEVDGFVIKNPVPGHISESEARAMKRGSFQARGPMTAGLVGYENETFLFLTGNEAGGSAWNLIHMNRECEVIDESNSGVRGYLQAYNNGRFYFSTESNTRVKILGFDE